METPIYSKILKNFDKHLINTSYFTKNTVSNYRKIAEYYLTYLETFGINNLNEAGQGILLKFAKFRGSQEYSTAYLNLRMSALKTFYTWAYKNRYCNNHPILEYRKSKLNHSILAPDKDDEELNDIVSLLPEEQGQLLVVMAKNADFAAIRNKCIVELILASALYAEEIVCLNYADLNLKKGYIDIANQNSERRVKLDITICQISCNAWLKCRNKMLTQNNEHNDCQFLFFTKNFEQLTKRWLYEIISQYLLKAGIIKEHLGADVLRQTAICNMFRIGKTIEEIQQATGIQTLARLEKYRLAAENT